MIPEPTRTWVSSNFANAHRDRDHALAYDRARCLDNLPPNYKGNELNSLELLHSKASNTMFKPPAWSPDRWTCL